MRVDKVLATVLHAQYSRVRIQKSILDGGLTINGIIVFQTRTCVHAGDRCRLEIMPTEEVRLKPNNSALDILYEDTCEAIRNILNKISLSDGWQYSFIMINLEIK